MVTITGASERTIRRLVDKLGLPQSGLSAFRGWRNRVILGRYASGRPIIELVGMFGLSRRQIYRILKQGQVDE